jgi:hypothetical protein
MYRFWIVLATLVFVAAGYSGLATHPSTWGSDAVDKVNANSMEVPE